MNMNITIGMIGTIASIIAAVVAYMTLRFTVRNSKGYILKQIDKKKKQIREIDIRLVKAYGLNRGRCHPITPLDEQKEKLEAEINELQRKL
jgi:hypothetical protein